MGRWKDISYLKRGNEIQRKAYRILNKIKILDILSKYNPILVGTIPIEIDVENSDLDIICKLDNVEEFYSFLIKEFGKYDKFKIKK